MTRLAVFLVTLLAGPLAFAGRPVPPRPVDIHRFEQDWQANRQRLADQAAQDGAAQSALQGSLTTPFEWATAGISAIQNVQELYAAYQGLTSFDTGCVDITAANAPPVPTGCGDDENSCSQCYRDAYRELAEARVKLEKLRCVYQATKRFADRAVSFGDSASGIHAVTGLAWQEQKKRILASVDELNGTYDRKLGEFIGKLEASLQHVGQCEQDFAGEPDWYTRFGFIYFTFMNDRYKRKDG